MTPRKSANEELTKDAIIDVARDLFVSEGYASTSMRKIAQILNCSHGAIYYHFKNKAELFFEIVEADFKKLDQELDDVMADTFASNDEKIFAILYRFIQFGLTHQNHYEVMFMIRNDDLKCYVQDGPNQSYYHFAQAIAFLSSKQLTTNEIWSLFLSMHGFVSHYCGMEITFEDVRDLVSSHVHFLLKAIK
ncbi:TetR/AcrR family transcriptional regulator [Bacillus sp. FJAT-29790]|uniref:TetR/AcrR family transcriptional regulator n=1 Tax=Bacillus sp. FJAT-29790 TaxID=1895002 RepID=UPI001C222337|nr:TetR/AcrR family transcriptional regulator [Bacillus sp. FJAT-29790]MBU8880480.1 TetR/AcrR family transcriptional regulator [Bacillus sp. FJAT-29790]